MENSTIVQSMAAKTRRYGAHLGGARWGRDGSHTPFYLLLLAFLFSFPPASVTASSLDPPCTLLFTLLSHLPLSCLPLPVPPLLFGSVLLSLFLPLIGGLDPGPLLLAPWPSAPCDTQLCPQVPQ